MNPGVCNRNLDELENRVDNPLYDDPLFLLVFSCNLLSTKKERDRACAKMI